MITKVTTSQINCFKRCRRRYKLEYVDLWKPKETPKALTIGQLYHKGVELLLKGEEYANVETWILDLQAAHSVINCIDEDSYVTHLALEMINAWYKWSDYKTWNIQAIEQEFEVTTGYGKRLKGKIDGLIEKEGELFLIEHKTTAVWGEKYLSNLMFDEQATNYLYAYSRMLEDGVINGRSVQGIFYDIIEKPTLKPFEATPIGKRKYTKEGKLNASQHEHDETPLEYRKRVHQWYEEKCRIHQSFVYRTQQQIDEHIADFNNAIKDLVQAERDCTYYRNPDSCKIMACPYISKCLEDTPETDELFIKKTQTNEELSK